MEWSRIWSIEPVPFHPALIELCEEAIQEVAGASHRMPSGPLHDAAEVARVGIPTVMLFAQSLRGISHNKIEDTKEDHIVLAVQALDRLATKTMKWIRKQGCRLGRGDVKSSARHVEVVAAWRRAPPEPIRVASCET